MKPMARLRRSLTRAVVLGVLLAGMVTAVAGAAPFVYVGTDATSEIEPSIFQFAANPATDVFPSDLALAGNGPSMFAISPDGGSAYVTNGSDGTISQYDVDAATGQLVPKGTPTVTTGGHPTAIVISGAHAYVPDGSDSILEYSIDPVSGALTALAPASVSTTGTPRSIAVSGTHVYVIVPTGSAFTVDVYDVGSDGQLSPAAGTSVGAGADPVQIVVSPHGTSAYVVNGSLSSNSNPGTVSEYDVDSSTGQLSPKSTPSVATGAEPTSIAISSDGRDAYVTNENDDTVSAYTVDSAGELTGTGTAATGVSGLGIAASQTSVYVTGFSQSRHTYAVTSYAIGSDGALTATGTNVTGQRPTAITVHGDSAYVIDADPFVREYDIAPATGQLSPKGTTATTAPQSISGMAVSPDASSLYTVDSDSPGAIVRYGIDPVTGALTVKGTAGTAGDEPTGIAISPSGQFAYVTNWSDQNVGEYAIDASSGQLTTVGAVPTGDHPRGIALAPGGRTAYVTNSSADTISQYALDPSTGQLSTAPTSTVATGSGPTGIVVAPNGQYAYVGNSSGSTVSEYTVDPATGQLTSAGTTTVPNSLEPVNIAVSPDGRAVYVMGNSTPDGPVFEFAVNPTTGALTAANPPWVGIDVPPKALAIAEPEALTVTTTGTGSGTVTSLPAGINCGSVCAHSFQYGVPVTLTATPAAGSQFAGWSAGGCTGTASTCTVTLSAPGTVSAAFAPAPPSSGGTPSEGSGSGGSGGSGSGGTTASGHTPGARATIGRVTVAGQTVTVVVACTGPAGARCKSAAALSVTETLHGKTIVGVAAAARRPTHKLVLVGTVTASVNAGHTKTLRLTLNAAGRRLLARYHRLKTRLTVTATGAKELSRTASLRSATPARRRGKR